jgi:hypothetical protein
MMMMFAPKYRIICGLILTVLTTCRPDRQSTKDSQLVADAPIAESKHKPPKDFLDSVRAKMHLTFSKIEQYAVVDSTYYKEHARFIGDTVWYRNGKRPLAVIRYNDKGISKKLLLVFNRRGDCTASLIVGMNGNADSFDSINLDYKIIDNNSFSTTETWTYRGGSMNDKITVTKQFYQINKKGRIMAQNNIIRSFTKPKALTAGR